jgi:hypothetical protein
MARAADIVSLRKLGLSLAKVTDVLAGGPRLLAPALAAHQAELEAQLHECARLVETVHHMRAKLAQVQVPTASQSVTIALPWPWNGESFTVPEIRPITFITGPLGSGKTRLARCLADTLPGASFVPMNRAADHGAAARRRLAADPDLKRRVDVALDSLVSDGAATSDALLVLLVEIVAARGAALVIDMVEQGLDQSTQKALVASLRQRGYAAPPLFLLTRSTAILDLGLTGTDESIIVCPANHSPPSLVAPCPGTFGYEAVFSCLASPVVRARTEGMIALMPATA